MLTGKNNNRVVTLRVDCRERAVIAALDAAPEGAVRIEQLDAGDFIIEPAADPGIGTTGKDSCVPLVCERKTLADLASSILDKRFIEQKQRMLALVRGQAKNVMYIIESEVSPFSLDPALNMPFSQGLTAGAIQTVIVDLQLVHGMSVVMTGSPAETARLLVRLARRMAEKPERYACLFLAPSRTSSSGAVDNDAQTPQAYASSHVLYTSCVKVKKADNIDPATCATLQLMVIPGVSSTTARAILEHFQVHSLKGLYDRLLGQSPDAICCEIANIKGLTSSGRRIGKALAGSIVRFLFLA